ncbi:MAG TPA: MFS transporter [Quisquiliibacterium sp.]|nr:MFS transporter [Quisquiliibacterium sp.]
MLGSKSWPGRPAHTRERPAGIVQTWPHELPHAAPQAPRHERTLESAALVLGLCYAAALFQRLAFQGVGRHLAGDFALDGIELADLGASFFWAYLILMIPCGILVDTLGPRRMAIFGALLSCAGCAIFAGSNGLLHLTVARMAIAAGGAFMFVCMMRFIVSSFPNRKTTMSGRGILVGNLGAIAAGAPLALVLTQMHWREVWASLAVGWLMLAILVRDRMPADSGGPLASMQPANLAYQLKAVFGSWQTYIGILILAGLAGTYWAFANLAAPRLLALQELSAVESGIAISILVLGYAIGAASWGWLGDRVGREALLTAACTLNCCTWLALGWVGPLSLTLAGALFFVAGFGSGAFGLLYAMLTERHLPSHGGMVIASVNCGIPLGAAVAQAAVGRLDGDAMMLPLIVGSLVAVFASLALWSVRRWRLPAIVTRLA